MNGLPYYKAYPRDFFEGTVGMRFELKGAYRLLIDLIYQHGGELPDDGRFIAGHLGCSVRAWNGFRRELTEAGKITCDNGIISNFRADKELESLGSFQEKQRKNRLRPNKNKNLPVSMVSPNDHHTDTDTDKEEEDAQARPFDSDFFRSLRAAVGVQDATAYWADSSVQIHVDAWRAFGLSDAAILTAAAESRARNPSPPDGPKALHRWMEQAAKAAQKPKGATPAAAPKATDAEMLAFWAERINGGAYVAPSSITPITARRLIDAGLVQPETLKKRGIAA